MPIKVGKWLRGIKLWSWIKKQFKGLNEEAKKLLPIAVEIVEKIKQGVEGPVGDVITALIPGSVDDAIRAKLKDWLPKLILQMALVESITNIEDEEERIKAVLDKIRMSPDELKNVYYHGLCALIIEKLSDGNFSWSDAVVVSEYYYTHFKKAA